MLGNLTERKNTAVIGEPGLTRGQANVMKFIPELIVFHNFLIECYLSCYLNQFKSPNKI